MSNNMTSYTTKAIHSGQDYNKWQNKEIVPPIVTSMTFHQDDPTEESVCF